MLPCRARGSRWGSPRCEDRGGGFGPLPGPPAGGRGSALSLPCRDPRPLRPAPGPAGARRAFAACLLAVALLSSGRAEAGHELTFYPSFYPQEIRIEVVSPSAAAGLLTRSALHAYLGEEPFGGAAPPAHIEHVESLGSFLVLTFNPAMNVLGHAPEARCAAVRDLLPVLAGPSPPFTLHPYPVTPYHPDYLHHVDLAESAKRASPVAAAGRGLAVAALRIRARGTLAEALLPARRQPEAGDWGATLEEVEVGDLIGARMTALNGWLGPPWLKDGWFHAYLLLAGAITDGDRRAAVEAMVQQLIGNAVGTPEERLNLERAFVSLLTRGCERAVVGYTVHRNYFTAEFSEGIENIAHDGQRGFLTPVFLRTAKLKDFPWNGWLRLGIASPPLAAWNPISGFTDPAGRLVWFAVGDPALLPHPSGGDWIPNRATVLSSESPPGGMPVPPDALLPEAGTGLLRPVGEGQRAGVRILYRVLLSAFHDGTRMTLADVLSPFMFAYRWGAPPARPGLPHDPAVEASTALLRKRLAGVRALRTERQVLDLGEVKVVREAPVIEVYLRTGGASPGRAAVIAPPWSTLPWPLVALMEEAVRRGLAAFSREEADRRGVAWLDLVRHPDGVARLVSLADELERAAYVPESLQGLVTPGDARRRWTALKEFARQRGHLLITNGPYRLDTRANDAVVLQVFRDLSYPLGVGAFDRYALLPRALITKIEAREDGLRISAEVERAVRVQRDYRIVREPLQAMTEVRGVRVESVLRFVALAPDGSVRYTGRAPIAADDAFTLRPAGWAPGTYTLLLAIHPNGNALNAQVKTVPYRVGR